jgi:hypothetical protein
MELLQILSSNNVINCAKIFHMKIRLYLTFLSSLVLSNNFTDEHIQKLKQKREITFGDLLHVNPGCLENSLCSKENGKRILAWRKNKTIKDIEAFRKKIGLPIQTLMLAKDTKTIDPIIYNSRCNQHNPKNQTQKIFKTILFLRNNPGSKKLVFTTVLNKDNGVSYDIPYGEQPLYMKDNRLHFVNDFEDLIYGLSIDKNNKWRALEISPTEISKALSVKEEVKCQKSLKQTQFFQGSYCSKIWNVDTKKTIIVEQSWSCP